MEYGSNFIWSFLGDASGCGRPSHLLNWLMEYGSNFIWSFLGDASGCGRPSHLLNW